MRNFIVVLIVALIVACGVAYAVGFIDVAGEQQSGKYVATVTINTAMLQRSSGATHEPAANPENEPANDSDNGNRSEFHGKISAVHPDTRIIVMAETAPRRTFELARDGRVTIDDQAAALQDLRPGDDAVVTYSQHGDTLMAKTIQTTRKANEQ
ncbi:MAG TPA: hypothetical protein VFE62_26715 [Gemmataceae bacterium]|nr:hypothetical protein [Gemmataceae bacterium]